jgi:hypothetical protein
VHVAGLARIYAADVDVCHLCNILQLLTTVALTARCDVTVAELITINMLPDDVLLEIFDLYVIEGFRHPSKTRRRQGGISLFETLGIQEWVTLAHVCRRWRTVVFQSPRRLNLRLLCTYKTPARDNLDVWPPLPLIIQDPYGVPNHWNGTSGVDNIIAALEYNDRVCQIILGPLTSSQLEYVTHSAATHKPFPELTHLRLDMYEYGPKPILPDSFLGGTAPRLRSLILDLLQVLKPGGELKRTRARLSVRTI